MPGLVGFFALTFSLAHVLIDYAVGVFGQGPSMSATQAALVLSLGALYAAWGRVAAAAAAGARWAWYAIALLAGVWAGALNGVVGFAACPPPCAGATPWQDLAHGGSLFFGAVAAWDAVRVARARSGPVARLPLLVTGVLIAVVVALEGIVAAP